jgi:hypothetical protein
VKQNRASKKFAALYEQALGAGLRLEVMLVPENVETGDSIEYCEFGAVQADGDLHAALGKVEAFLSLPSVAAITEALAERKVIVSQLDSAVERVNAVLADLSGVDVALTASAEEALAAAALLAASLVAPGSAVPPSKPRVIDQSAFRVVTVQPSATPAPTVTAPAVERIVDIVVTPAPSRPVVHQPEVKPEPELKSTPKPKARRTASGVPTYYCKAGSSRCTSGYPDVAGNQMYAAAGPSLRVGKWRGRVVSVTANGQTIQVKLIDWCACGGDHFIDLYYDAFKMLGFPSILKAS